MMCGTGVMVHCSQGGAVQNWRFVALQRYNPSDCVKIAVSLSPLEGGGVVRQRGRDTAGCALETWIVVPGSRRKCQVAR